jgi:hypothetical protein
MSGKFVPHSCGAVGKSRCGGVVEHDEIALDERLQSGAQRLQGYLQIVGKRSHAHRRDGKRSSVGACSKPEIERLG